MHLQGTAVTAAVAVSYYLYLSVCSGPPAFSTSIIPTTKHGVTALGRSVAHEGGQLLLHLLDSLVGGCLIVGQDIQHHRQLVLSDVSPHPYGHKHARHTSSMCSHFGAVVGHHTSHVADHLCRQCEKMQTRCPGLVQMSGAAADARDQCCHRVMQNSDWGRPAVTFGAMCAPGRFEHTQAHVKNSSKSYIHKQTNSRNQAGTPTCTLSPGVRCTQPPQPEPPAPSPALPSRASAVSRSGRLTRSGP